jgi:hypothetical protein
MKPDGRVRIRNMARNRAAEVGSGSMRGSAAFSHSGQPENYEINSLSIQALQLAVARVSAYLPVEGGPYGL